MKLDLTGLRIEVTDAIRDFTEKKVEKLSKFFDEETICHVTFSAPVKAKQNVNIRIEYKSRTYLAETDTEDYYYSIEELVNKIEGQIRKDKALIEKKRRETIPEQEIEDIEDILDEE
ncbi:MAG: ribosome-associated translation inhibitor RaiA [Clostridia bacterium]